MQYIINLNVILSINMSSTITSISITAALINIITAGNAMSVSSSDESKYSHYFTIGPLPDIHKSPLIDSKHVLKVLAFWLRQLSHDYHVRCCHLHALFQCHIYNRQMNVENGLGRQMHGEIKDDILSSLLLMMIF